MLAIGRAGRMRCGRGVCVGVLVGWHSSAAQVRTFFLPRADAQRAFRVLFGCWGLGEGTFASFSVGRNADLEEHF